MEIKLGTLIRDRDVLEKLANIEFAPGVAFRLCKLLREIDVHLQDIEKIRVGLVKKYGTNDDGRFLIKQDSDQFDNFNRELSEFLDGDVTLEHLEEAQLTADDFEDNLSVALISRLDWLIK